MTDDRMIAALLRERDAYQRQGKADRVALVDEQLRLRGHQDPAAEPPKERSGKPLETAEEKPKRGRPRKTVEVAAELEEIATESDEE